MVMSDRPASPHVTVAPFSLSGRPLRGCNLTSIAGFYHFLPLPFPDPWLGGYTQPPQFLMKSKLRKSNKAHDQHVAAGVTDAKATRWLPSEARDEKTGENSSLRRRRLVSAVQDSVGFECAYCGRSFEKKAGLSLHVTRWCEKKPSGAGGDPTLGNPPLAAHNPAGMEAQHHNLPAWNYALVHQEQKKPSNVLNSISMKPRINLPNAANRRKWMELDQEIYTTIVMSIPSSELRSARLNDILPRFTTIVYNTAKKLCGLLERKRRVIPERARKPATLHQLQMQKRNARRNLRRVKREGGDVTAAQKALMTAVRMHNDALRSIRRARNERKRLDDCRRFLSDPNAFAKKLLNPPVEAKAAFAKEVADDYFKKTYSDPNRSFCYTPPPDLPRPKLPEHPFDTKFATFEEFSRICRKKSNGSAPGPNGIPYLLYKCCPKVRKVLWSLLNRVWMEKCIPTEFQVGRVRLLPKSTDTSHPKLMRPISILNSEGRLFWTVFQLRMSRYMISNKYIQPHVQKGFIEGVAGCIEHTTTHWEMLQDAKKRRRIIVLAWLDLENAYGSIRHMLVQFAMKWYYVPQRICDLLFRYYEDIFLRVVTDNWTSDYFHLAIGVPQGCTASTIMFDVAFQVVIDIWRWKTRDISPGYTIKGADICISYPTYADDVELVGSDVKECQGSIDCFQSALAWSKTLKAKPEEC